ncbi:uncharacterized protein LOC143039071 [Oratosquilla oratoria]|uniref:uncharacterized protein LOC143039071 n=1 Tax=Oratosquilla oratoria TaxID=337810 RepID=UPI003F777440
MDKICFTTEAVRAEKRHLRDVFRSNCYPSWTVGKWTRTRRTGTQSPHTGHRVTIPYINGASEVTARTLRDRNIQVVHKPRNTLHHNLTRVKDTEVPTQQAGEVYRIGCLDCDGDYIGETQKKLTTRIEEHKRAVRRNDAASALYKLINEQKHNIDWKGATVVNRDNSKKRRLFLEAWTTKDGSVNRCIDFNPIYLVTRNTMTDAT